ncbi:hypothetical protein MCAV_00430 [[Mycoplasma] cavipharyngis]|uniref:Mbov_0400 family ICE element protein n=1 Tax=[Mycoplasma] cavipharyngis TaxID=92757 RepID=UPI003703943C
MNPDLKLKAVFPKKRTVITFNELGKGLGHHPIIVYYSEAEDEYYYLKIRSARDNDGNLKKIKNKEIFVPKNSNDKQLLYNDSYIDTTKIFRIKKPELISIIDSKKIYHIERIDPVYAILIYETLGRNLDQEPPFCSLMKVSFDQNIKEFTSETEYTHRKLIDSEYNELISEDKIKYDKTYQFLIKNRCKTTLEVSEILNNLEGSLYHDRRDYRYQNSYHLNRNKEFSNEIEKLFVHNWDHFRNKNLSNLEIESELKIFSDDLKYLLENKYVPPKSISYEEFQTREMLINQWLKNLDPTRLILTPAELTVLKKNPNYDLIYKEYEPKTNEILFEYLQEQGIQIDIDEDLRLRYFIEHKILREYIKKVNLEYLKNKFNSYER